MKIQIFRKGPDGQEWDEGKYYPAREALRLAREKKLCTLEKDRYHWILIEWDRAQTARYRQTVRAGEKRKEDAGEPVLSWEKMEEDGIEVASPEEDLSASMEKQEIFEAMHRAIAGLKPAQRTVIERLYLGETEATEKEVAEALSCPRSTVHQRKKEALAALRKKLEAFG